MGSFLAYISSWLSLGHDKCHIGRGLYTHLAALAIGIEYTMGW
jgi:hypothetical protein